MVLIGLLAIVWGSRAGAHSDSDDHHIEVNNVSDSKSIAPPSGLFPSVHALHIHSSFDEGVATMTGQLQEAKRAGVDFVHFTTHDNRAAVPTGRYREWVNCSSPAEPKQGGRDWLWSSLGVPNSNSIARFDTLPGAIRNAMHLKAHSNSGSAEQLVGFRANTDAKTNYEQRGNIGGRTFQPRFLIKGTSGQAWMELRLKLSFQSDGKPLYLRYRFGPTLQSTERPNSHEVIIYRQMQPGKVRAPLITPENDVRNYFPNAVARDNSVIDLYMQAVARNGGYIDGYFTGMTMKRNIKGQAALNTAKSTLAEVNDRYGNGVLGRDAIEFSNRWHINGYNGEPGVSIPLLNEGATYSYEDVVQHVHANQGFTSYNHPFGVQDPNSGMDSDAQQMNRVMAKAKELINEKVYNSDSIEVGYFVRGKVDLEHHLKLGEILVANGYFATWTGVSDNHTGKPNSWTQGNGNNFATQLWVSGNQENDHKYAVQQGRAAVTMLGKYDGNIWVGLDNTFMGDASVKAGAGSRQIKISVSSMPSGGKLEVVKGKIAYLNPGQITQPNASVISTFSAAQMSTGSKVYNVNTAGGSSFFYLRVLDSSGAIVAFTNPVMHLTSEPPDRGLVSERRIVR